MEAKRRGPKPGAELITTTISLDPATHKKLRRRALEEGTTLRALIREAVRAYAKGGK
jgi:hypothetical protein